VQVLRGGELGWPSGWESLYTRGRRVHAGAYVAYDGAGTMSGGEGSLGLMDCSGSGVHHRLGWCAKHAGGAVL